MIPEAIPRVTIRAITGRMRYLRTTNLAYFPRKPSCSEKRSTVRDCLGAERGSMDSRAGRSTRLKKMATRIPTLTTRAICRAGIMLWASSAEMPATVVRPVNRIGLPRERMIFLERSFMVDPLPLAFSSWYLAIIWIP